MAQYTILIVNWNSWDVLSRCLEALSHQTCKDFRIIVADNASDQSQPHQIFSKFPRLTFVQNKSNYGFAKANNHLTGLSYKSEWIILLNPDAFPEPDWLEQLIKATSEYPDYSFFASRLLMEHNGSLLDGDGDSYHISGLVRRREHGKNRSKESAPEEIFSSCAAAAMYRTTIVREAGGFDEDFFCYLEDVDLGFRLRLAGYKCLLIPTAIVNHVGSATTGGQQSDIAVYYGHRNLVWTYVKNMPGALFWLFIPIHILLNVFSLFWFTARGQGDVIFRAKWDAIKGIPAMLRKRRLIQSARVAPDLEILRVMDKRLIPWDR